MNFKKILLTTSTLLSVPAVFLSSLSSCSKEDKDLVKVDKITSYLYIQLLYSNPFTLVKNGKLKLQWNHSKFDPWQETTETTEKLFCGFFTPAVKTTEESVCDFLYSSCTLSVDNLSTPLTYKNPDDFKVEDNNTFTITHAEDLLPSIEQKIMCVVYRCDSLTQSTNINLNINVTTPPNVDLIFTTLSMSSFKSSLKGVK